MRRLTFRFLWTSSKWRSLDVVNAAAIAGSIGLFRMKRRREGSPGDTTDFVPVAGDQVGREVGDWSGVAGEVLRLLLLIGCMDRHGASPVHRSSSVHVTVEHTEVLVKGTAVPQHFFHD